MDAHFPPVLSRLIFLPQQARPFALVFGGLLAPASAAPYYWDPGATNTTGGGGAGVWSTTATNWYDLTDRVAWPTTNPSTHEAFFSNTGGAISVESSVFVNKITIGSTGYTFTRPASTAHTITFNGTAPSITATETATIAVPLVVSSALSINGDSSDNLTISGAISGSGSISVNSNARLTMSSTSGNTISGGVTVNGGTLNVSSNSTGRALGTSTLTLNGGTFAPRYIGTTNGNMDNTMAPVAVTANSTFDVRSAGSSTNVTIRMSTLSIGSNTLSVVGANNFSAAFTGATTLSGNAVFNVANSVGSATKYGLSLSTVGQTGSNRNLTKSGTGTMAINGTLSYTGTTTVSGGALYLNGNGAAATGNITVASAATFGGNNIVGGATTISGIHAPGELNTIGTQTFSNLLTYASTSSLQWQLSAGLADPGDGALNVGSYDRVIANGGIAGSSTFDISLFTGAFTDAFWDTDKAWDNVVTGAADLSTLFTSFSGVGVDSSGTVEGQGAFSFTQDSLVWTAIPEPTTPALLSTLAVGMFLRRRRSGK